RAARRLARVSAGHRLTGHRLRLFGLRRLITSLQVLAEVTVPGRDDDRDRARRPRLARKSYYGSRLVRLDVAEERHHLALAPVHLRQFLRAAEHADPARAARGRAALHGYRPFVDGAARVQFVPRPLVRGRAG